MLNRQMAAFSPALDTKRLIYVVINFDDRLHEYVDDVAPNIYPV